MVEKERLKKVERLEQVRKEIVEIKKEVADGKKNTLPADQENPDYKKGLEERETRLAALVKEEGKIAQETFVSDKCETPPAPPAPVELEVDEDATAEAENESETFKVSEPEDPTLTPLEGEHKSKKGKDKKGKPSQHPAEPADIFK